MLCLCFYVFFNGPGDSKHLGSAGRQADEYIAPGGKFFYVFMCLILPMNRVIIHRTMTRMLMHKLAAYTLAAPPAGAPHNRFIILLLPCGRWCPSHFWSSGSLTMQILATSEDVVCPRLRRCYRPAMMAGSAAARASAGDGKEGEKGGVAGGRMPTDV
jgi:hypothetical protein